MRFFYPDIAAAIDWSRGFEPLDGELQKIAVKAALGQRLADKLIKELGIKLTTWREMGKLAWKK